MRERLDLPWSRIVRDQNSPGSRVAGWRTTARLVACAQPMSLLGGRRNRASGGGRLPPRHGRKTPRPWRRCGSRACTWPGRLLAWMPSRRRRRLLSEGGISLAFPDYGPSLFSELNRIRPESSLQVKPSILGYQGALLGACACAVRGLSSPLDEASLPGSGSELRITSSHGKTACRLLCGGEDLLPAGAGDLGSFLVASGASDEGIELDGLLGGVSLEFLVRRAEQGNADDLGAVERFGRSLGAAVSYCATLLDPAAIVFEDDLAAAEGLYREEVLGAIEDDSYWQREGLPYVIEWCPPRPKGRLCFVN